MTKLNKDLFGPTERPNDSVFQSLPDNRPEHYLPEDRCEAMFLLANLLDRQWFNPAVTNSWNPHWYLMDHHWVAKGEVLVDFHRAKGVVYKFGYDSKWGQWNFRGININGGYFWLMGPPGHVDYDIINAKHRLYKTYWDFIASRYHDMSAKVSSIVGERKKQLEIIGDMKDKRVLELGCGPGWLLEYTGGGVGRYTGIDHSQKMLVEFAARLPEWYRKVRICSVKEYFSTGEKYDLVLALSGMGHQMTNEDAKKCMMMLDDGGRLIAATYGKRAGDQPLRDRYGISESYRKTERPFDKLDPEEKIGIYDVHVWKKE